MKLRYLLKRMFHQPPSYILGRFLTVRRIYSLYRKTLPNPSTKFGDLEKVTIFDKLDISIAVKDLKTTAVALGFDLPEHIVNDIREFAANCELKADNVPYKFFYNDISEEKLPDGTVVAIGYAVAPEKSNSVCKVLNDPSLHQVVKNYLGYKPSNYEVRLYYSFVADLTDRERRDRNQTIDYHFDVHSFNFCYAHFYLTDTDKNSGAHALVKSSHHKKPFNYLLSSARKSDDQINKYYDRSEFLVIEGQAGTGFLEDTSCYHKAFAPITKDRLLLQIRFF